VDVRTAGLGERDAFLDVHRLGPGFFDLRHRFSPASIRDQVVRASMLVDRLWDDHWIDDHDRDQFVVGAGVAGVSAAIWAARKGVRVTLVDKNKRAFERQRVAENRWIDPTLYDWPAHHWWVGKIPFEFAEDQPARDDPLPLRLKKGPANRAAFGWNQILEQSKQDDTLGRMTTEFDCRFGQLFFQYDREAEDPLAADHAGEDRGGGVRRPMVVAEWVKKGRAEPSRQRFGAAIRCTGLDDADGSDEGNSLCLRGRIVFRGFAFWRPDNYSLENAGIHGEPAWVLISGGGDGALQDLLRLINPGPLASSATLDPTAMYRIIHDSGIAKWGEKLRRIQTAEDQASRRYIWSTGEVEDRLLLKELHDTYVEIVDEIQRDAAWQRIHQEFEARIRFAPHVTFVHRQAAFGRCYPMNHLLVVVAIRYLETHPRLRRQFTYRPGQQIATFECTHDGAHGDAEVCEGKRHRVVFKLVDQDCRDRFRAREDSFNVIIIRHGPGRPCGKQDGASRSRLESVRQALPYHFERYGGVLAARADQPESRSSSV